MKKKAIKPKEEKINVHDDAQMDSLGILYRKPGFVKDPSVWSKTDEEKMALKKARSKSYPQFTASSRVRPKKSIPCYGKLIVNIYPVPSFIWKHYHSTSKTTIAFDCGQGDIPRILSKFVITETNKNGKQSRRSIVRSYKWNGKTYKSNELPFGN